MRQACTITVLAGTLLLAACSGDGGGETAADAPAAEVGDAAAERQTAPADARPYEAPEDFPLGFTTLVPAGWDVELLGEDEGAIQFSTDVDGDGENRAYLQITVYPPGMRGTRARSFAKSWVAALGLAVSHGIETHDVNVPKRWDWSLVEYDFRYQRGDREPGQWLVGTVAIGMHADRYFQVILHYPLDYADEFVSEANRILESWRWQATGAGLGAR